MAVCCALFIEDSVCAAFDVTENSAVYSLKCMVFAMNSHRVRWARFSQHWIHVNYYTVPLKYADLTLVYGKAFPVRCDSGVSIKYGPQLFN
jgi:hypothetical protein